MKKKVFFRLGYLSLAISLFFIINFLQSITGFVIIEHFGKSAGNFLGLLFLILGILFFVIADNWDKYRIGLVIREYESGELNPVQAALKINDQLFPSGIKITGVDYRRGVSETIKTEEEYVPIKLRDETKARDLALALYEIAIINSRKNAKNCELHLGRQASSKHHMEGLKKIIERFEEKYKKDLETIKSA